MNRSGTFKKHFWLSEKVSVQKEQDSVFSSSIWAILAIHRRVMLCDFTSTRNQCW